jgi:hypothetical protein
MNDSKIPVELERARFRQKQLIAKWSGDELILYDEETNTAHCLNAIAAAMWMACHRESSVGEVAAGMHAGWPNIEKEVVAASLSQMVSAGLLEETSKQAGSVLSRRELIRQLGITAGVAIPIVLTSVLIPSPAAAASCSTLGQPCSGTMPCCPGQGLGCVAGVCLNVGR